MNFKTAAIAIALAAGAGLASAQEEETPTMELVLSPAGEGMFGATFIQNVSGFFLDTFTFDPPDDFSGTVMVSLVPSGPINFAAAILNNESFPYIPETDPENFEFTTMVDSDMPLTLQVFGFAGFAGDDESPLLAMDASYTGTITTMAVAAIPEPQTYALMLAGLAFLGAWSRRRKA